MDWIDWSYIGIICAIIIVTALAIALMWRSQARLSRSLLGKWQKTSVLAVDKSEAPSYWWKVKPEQRKGK